MQAIVVKYMQATNHRPARIKAECQRGSVTIAYDHGNVDQYDLAVKTLLRKFVAEDIEQYEESRKSPWAKGVWTRGDLPDSSKWHHVYTYNNSFSELHIEHPPDGCVSVREEESQ